MAPRRSSSSSNQKRHHLGELHVFLLAIRKAGYVLSLYQRLAFICDMTERGARRVAHQPYTKEQAVWASYLHLSTTNPMQRYGRLFSL